VARAGGRRARSPRSTRTGEEGMTVDRRVSEALNRIERKLDALPSNQGAGVISIAVFSLAFGGLLIWLT